MRNFFCPVFGPILFGYMLLFSGVALGQVYKCTDKNGKTSYSDLPCANLERTKQRAVRVEVAPSPDGSSAKEVLERKSEVRRQRQLAGQPKEETERNNRNSANLRGNGSSVQPDQKLIADCEANRGARCSDPNVMAQNRMNNTPITDRERQQAVGERRARERNEALERAVRR
jgi:hypothetical protein